MGWVKVDLRVQWLERKRGVAAQEASRGGMGLLLALRRKWEEM